MVPCSDLNTNGCLPFEHRRLSLLIHAGWKRDVAKECLGESPTTRESVMKRGRAQELAGQVAECRIARGHEPEGIDRRGEPQTPGPKEGRETFFEKYCRRYWAVLGLLAQIFHFSQPVETIRFQTNTFIETGRRGTLAESLSGFRDELRRNILVIIQNPAFAEQGSQSGANSRDPRRQLCARRSECPPAGRRHESFPVHRPAP